MPDARRLFFSKLMEHGFRLIKLQPLDAQRKCTCRERENCRNPGKHPVNGRHVYQSLFSSVEGVLDHLDCGGGVGLALWYHGKSLRYAPLRLVVFDCDDAQAEAWLAARGITSFLKVRGDRGVHIYCLLMDGLPLFKSNTKSLRPVNGTPAIDVKTSGLVVLPWSPNKRLEINGQDASEDPAAVSRLMENLQDFAAALPQVDPAIVCPGMVPRVSKKETTPRHPQKTACPAAPRNSKLPRHRPKAGEFDPPLSALDYGERLKRARRYAQQSAPPSIQGQQPRAMLFKLVCNLLRHFGLSQQDTWCVVKAQFNPRCLYRNGGNYPWRRVDVVDHIRKAAAEPTYATLTQAALTIPGWVSPDLTLVIQRQQRRGIKANERKQQRRLEERLEECGVIQDYFREFDLLVCEAVEFKPLLADINTWLTVAHNTTVSAERLRQYLRNRGRRVEAGRILTGKRVA